MRFYFIIAPYGSHGGRCFALTIIIRLIDFRKIGCFIGFCLRLGTQSFIAGSKPTVFFNTTATIIATTVTFDFVIAIIIKC